MKRSIIALAAGLATLFIVAAPAAAKCITVCYYDAGAAPDVICEQAPWSNVAGFRDFLPVVSIFVQFDNPLGNSVRDEHTGQMEYSLASVATTGARAKQGIQVTRGTLATDCSGCATVTKRNTYFESLASNDPVSGKFNEDPPTRRARLFQEAAEVVLLGISFQLDDALYERLQADALADPLAQGGACR